MLYFDKDSNRVVKYFDRAPGEGRIWEGLRNVHFMNGSIAPADKVRALVICKMTLRGDKPWVHATSCTAPHDEQPNPEWTR